jgi:hypothetical protein
MKPTIQQIMGRLGYNPSCAAINRNVWVLVSNAAAQLVDSCTRELISRDVSLRVADVLNRVIYLPILNHVRIKLRKL